MTYGVDWPISVWQFETHENVIIIIIVVTCSVKISREIYIFLFFFFSLWFPFSVLFGYVLRYLGKRKIFSFFRITDTEESISLDSIKFDLKFLQNAINRFLIKLIKVTDLEAQLEKWENEFFGWTDWLINCGGYWDDDDDFYEFNNSNGSDKVAITNLEKISKAR